MKRRVSPCFRRVLARLLALLTGSARPANEVRARNPYGQARLLQSMPAMLLLLSALLAAPSAFAQEMTPRAYWPAPEGTRVLSLGTSFVSGDVVPDPSLPISGLDSSINTAVVGYSQVLNLWGRTSSLILSLPYVDGETSADIEGLGTLVREYGGLGDASATLSVNLMGAPSMSRDEFREWRGNPQPILGASIKVVAPTGAYDNSRVINAGANRWAAKAEIGYIRRLTQKTLLEVEAGSWFFQDNDDFVGFRRSQDPLTAIEVHLIRRFKPGFWASLEGTIYRGGRGALDGMKLDDVQRDSRLGATLVFPLARGHAIKASYTHGSVNDSDEDFNIYALSYQRVF